MIELRTLGSLELRERDGAHLHSIVSQPRRFALLSYLALSRPRGFHQRDSITAIFWPEHEQERARADLRQAIYILRRSLGEDTILNRGDAELAVNHAKLWCDVLAFEDALDAARVEEAMSMYRGPLLPGFYVSGAPEFDYWLERERKRLQVRASGACWQRSTEMEQRGHAHGALEWAKQAHALAPADEVSLRRLLELQIRLGDRAGALQVYDQFAKTLHEQYELEPAPQTQAIAAALRVATATSASPRRIAVLPLECIPADVESEALALDISEILVARLSQYPNLIPISRTSVLQYRGVRKTIREISAELNVGLVVEGTLLRVDHRVRATVHLVDSLADRFLWGASFEQKFEHASDATRDIAIHMANVLGAQLSTNNVQLTRKPATVDPQAYRDYMLGRYFLCGVEAEQAKAMSYFQRAIERDPLFAEAHASLGFIYMLIGTTGHIAPAIGFERAKAATQRALALDTNLWEAQSTLASLSFWYDWDWAKAALQFQKAKSIGPSTLGDSYVPFCLCMGANAEGLAEAHRGVEIDPLSAFRVYGLAWACLMAHRFDEAIAHSQEALELRPDFAWARVLLALAYTLSGDMENATREAASVEQLVQADPILYSFVAYTYADAGRLESAHAIVQRIIALQTQRYIDPWCIAVIYAGLADADRCMEWLERAFENRSPNMVYMASTAHSLFRKVSGDARYRWLTEQMKFPRTVLQHVSATA